MSEVVSLTREGSLAVVTIDRPPVNSLDGATLTALQAALKKLGQSDARAAILTGAGGKAFVAGADIEAMSTMTASEAHEFARLGQAVFAKLESLPMPVIAAVDGFALGGGCELALACDFIYASDKLKIGQPEAKLGVLPGFGGTQRLARRVGLGMARELIYTGRQIGAAEALRIGLVNAVFPRAELMDAAKKTALEMAAMSPNALLLAKRVMNEGAGLPLTTAIELEAQAFSDCFAHADQREGMIAFLQKRPAQFAERPEEHDPLSPNQ
jgi:enoyl-CoA hydratase